MTQIEDVKKRHELELLGIEGVEGVGVTEDKGHAVLTLYIGQMTDQLRRKLPTEIEGYPVRTVITGGFVAL